MNNISIDGHKPIEFMTDEEKDEYFKKEFGVSYEEFCEKNDKATPISFSDLIKE